MTQRVCLVSGGTGGHLMPALVLARGLLDAGREPLLVTEGRDVERELLRRELPQLACVELPASRRVAWSMPAWLVRATRCARRELRDHGVAGVVSTGGRASLPVALAAKSLRLPLFLLEQNAITGRANRWLAPLAARVYHGLPSIEPMVPQAILTGTPLRPGFGRLERPAARRALGLDPELPVVVVTGGSQGARALNGVVPDALVGVGQRARLQVVHLSGLGNDVAVRQRYAAGAPAVVAHVRPVAADMDRLFAAADLVVGRSGGTTVAELAAAARAAILVPYPHHRDRQQLHNARVLARVGAAVVIEQRDLEAAALERLVADLLADPARLHAMGREAGRLGRLDAAADILADVQRELEQRERGEGRAARLPLASGRAATDRGEVV